MTGTRQATPEQVNEVARLLTLLEDDGKKVCVHWNECGCCVSVHEDVPEPSVGYVVGPDGGSDWIGS